MAIEVKMPQLGLTMTEGVVASWKKKVGDTIKIGDVLADIETDKLSTELESEVEGIILALVAKEGDDIPVQGVICIVGAEGETVAAPAAPATPAPAVAAQAPAAAPAPVAASAPVQQRTAGERIRISPLAKKVAAANSVDYSGIAGTGPGGRIVQKDILATKAGGAASAPAPSAASSVPAIEGGRRERMTSMRKVVADRMFKSHSEIPVVTQTVKIDVTDLVAFRTSINEKRETRFSINDFVLKAVAKALAKQKQVLVSIDGTDIVHHDNVHIGMAVALEEGLIVPVIKHADKMGLETLSANAKDLAERARSGSLQMEEYQGATFSVSNLGMYGVESFTPIINQPNAAILGVCSIEDELALIDGQPVARKIMRISMTYDHRLLDGAAAAKFQLAVKELLEHPMDVVL